MYQGRTVFSQVLDFLPRKSFRTCVKRYNGNYRIRSFSCYEQFLCMAFAQLTYRESLRDTVLCLRGMHNKLHNVGIQCKVARSTLADANEKRDWRIYCDFAQALIGQARKLYADEDFGLELEETVYALDASTIDLCRSVFPWARFRSTKSGIKVHTLLDLRGNIPSFVRITDANVHDVNILDELLPEPGSIYVMDRAYLDFDRLHRLHRRWAFFILRTKANTKLRRLYSSPVDKSSGVICDQTVRPVVYKSAIGYPEKLRRIKYFDTETEKRLTFLTNHFELEARTVADLYKSRWQVELFFKWIKQHLRIKKFFGVSETAVKTQIWIAISVYVLVAIMKKRLALDQSLYTIFQVLSITLFEKTLISRALTENDYNNKFTSGHIQLNLFDS
ncbi:IS4 family transposase [uncultured Desulfosarcina sp.]|uniref:IS4 family transposase n=1 Tax=uncultured Desulfosarcina sp. TaxID=218289 RepID=UPI0029C6B65D|nr:IS4 family transposase [uncultured Desulfosarcina sp.]